jgi:F0F1-type ATP synthase membrane subunit c/vacuolar-type H+-ATPase subunit K
MNPIDQAVAASRAESTLFRRLLIVPALVGTMALIALISL